jgi:hypothetical protein
MIGLRSLFSELAKLLRGLGGDRGGDGGNFQHIINQFIAFYLNPLMVKFVKLYLNLHTIFISHPKLAIYLSN